MLNKNLYPMVICNLYNSFFSYNGYTCLDVYFEMTPDLQQVLDSDISLLQQQTETVKLEQLYNDLKTICERIEKSQQLHKVLSLPFFSGPNASCGKFICKILRLSSYDVITGNELFFYNCPRYLQLDVCNVLFRLRNSQASNRTNNSCFKIS